MNRLATAANKAFDELNGVKALNEAQGAAK